EGVDPVPILRAGKNLGPGHSEFGRRCSGEITDGQIEEVLLGSEQAVEGTLTHTCCRQHPVQRSRRQTVGRKLLGSQEHQLLPLGRIEALQCRGHGWILPVRTHLWTTWSTQG